MIITPSHQPEDNWTRGYDWESKRQGTMYAVYPVDKFEPSMFWRVLRFLGVM